MSLSAKYFTTQSASQHEETIESLHLALTNARRESNPDQNKIASIKARIRDLELRAMKTGDTQSYSFRTIK